MTFLEALRSHKGGLIRLKGELFWYGGRGWDGIRGRVCLLMDARDAARASADHAAATAVPTAAAIAGFGTAASVRTAADLAAACLLIDGRPRWVWIAPADVELL
jgi:hypothetical protein